MIGEVHQPPEAAGRLTTAVTTLVDNATVWEDTMSRIAAEEEA